METLSDWLTWISTQHPVTMDLGLTRIRRVAEALDLMTPSVPVITVGGTNGKGSTVAALESIYEAAGYRTGLFTSPHLFHYRERIRINKKPLDDPQLIQALTQIDLACRQFAVTLTYFEYTTLAALWLFKQAQCDILILEVGLGGRLDAVNLLDPTVAVITSISLDHVDYLGDTREKIAVEKAGIFRTHTPAVCGDRNPPLTLIEAADRKQAPLFCIGTDYTYQEQSNHWDWIGPDQTLTELPIPRIFLQNAATALMVIQLMISQRSVEKSAIIQGLKDIDITARCQLIYGKIDHIVDVSHNPDSVSRLANYIRAMPCQGKTIAVVGMLKDKDMTGTLANIGEWIDQWHIGSLHDIDRGASAEELADAAKKAGLNNIATYANMALAYQTAYANAIEGDRIVVFGSFHTVANVWDLICQVMKR